MASFRWFRDAWQLLPNGERRFEAIRKKVDLHSDALDRLLNELEFLRKRHAIYLGDNVSLSFLIDQTPIFVNANDTGPAINIINGGVYEPENMEVILSFVTPSSVFLDIGANIGIFSLYVARRVAKTGRVYAFEPQKNLAFLIKRSAFLSGFGNLEDPGTINCFAVGASDKNRTVGFHIPEGHLAGGHVHEGGAGHSIEVARLDDLLGADFQCNLVKIDVEGHELPALRGMSGIIANSPNIKILFEKLGLGVGTEEGLEDSFFADRGMELWAVGPNAMLSPLPRDELARFDGYVLAAHSRDPDMTEMYRGRFFIYPSQLHPGPKVTVVGERLEGTASRGQMLFHGPYWFLGRGQYRMRLHGRIDGAILMTIATRFGYPGTRFEIHKGATESFFTLDRDAVLFECVASAAERVVNISLEGIEIIRGWE